MLKLNSKRPVVEGSFVFCLFLLYRPLLVLGSCNLYWCRLVQWTLVIYIQGQICFIFSYSSSSVVLAKVVFCCVCFFFFFFVSLLFLQNFGFIQSLDIKLILCPQPASAPLIFIFFYCLIIEIFSYFQVISLSPLDVNIAYSPFQVFFVFVLLCTLILQIRLAPGQSVAKNGWTGGAAL